MMILDQTKHLAHDRSILNISIKAHDALCLDKNIFEMLNTCTNSPNMTKHLPMTDVLFPTKTYGVFDAPP